ncbi:putative laminin A chain [Operophtera brumata]|uniref:Putative laminin A chain n=1 Tax=Operophtera brumata TaxID=104452 RepID=A0A0L7L7T9_OPEBR|nr:putative laminin A chain [Operophtera brumata]
MSTYRQVKTRQDELERGRRQADERLAELRGLIEQARTVANRIQVGVTFDRWSTLQPRLPDTVDEMSTSTHDDFMVVGVQNGYPYLVMDIGDSAESGREPARIGSDKVGRNVKLAIRESLDNGTEHTHSKEAVLPGQHTIFNLDRDKSRLYVGGVPSDAKLQGVSFPAFEGQIEELVIGDTPVGLWNFASANNLKGARQRDKLISSQSGPQEYRFNGRAHVTVPGRRYLTEQKNHVLLFFRTYAPDGLIYLAGEGAYFFSIQMQDGKVSLGNPEELLIIGTAKSYNDGKWHKLDAGRYLTKCSLRVDDEIVKSESTSSASEISALDTMNFGGNNKGIIQVTDKGFDGYLRFVDITTENLQLTLKFKTSKPDGLLFVYVSRTQTTATPDSISLSLMKGKLVLMSQRETLDTGLSTYNDSQWHVVTVTHNENALRLVVDDFDYFSTDTAPKPLHILDGVLFVGGVQPGYVVGGAAGSKLPFEGCIADAALNTRVLHLLQPYANSSVVFGRCGQTTSGGVTPEQTSWLAPQRADVLPTPVEQPAAPPPDVTRSNGTLEGFDLTVTFRTFDQHGGLLFYARADKDPAQFLALYMKDAMLHCAFNCGGETAHISSSGTYNDTEWHTVTLTRNGGHGKIAVDSEHVFENSATCSAPAVLAAPYYYGGLRELTEAVSNNLEGFYQPFKGCLKGLMMNGQAVTEVAARVNSLRCTDNIENGVYFGASNNAHSNYLKVRPRNSTGLLLSVHGKKDYLVLELLDDEIAATVENGNGPFRATYKLANSNMLCDGTWHKIHGDLHYL